MDTSTIIVAIIGALGGGAGLTAVLTTIFQYRKYREEADTIHVQNEQIRSENERTEMDYVKKSLIEMQELYKKEMNEMRESNRILEQRIDVLNKKLSSLMNWIVGDDHRYRSWLESKLHELDPSLQFPELSDPPTVFDDDDRSTKSLPEHPETTTTGEEN